MWALTQQDALWSQSMKQFILKREDLGNPHEGGDFVLGYGYWVESELVERIKGGLFNQREQKKQRLRGR